MRGLAMTTSSLSGHGPYTGLKSMFGIIEPVAIATLGVGVAIEAEKNAELREENRRLQQQAANAGLPSLNRGPGFSPDM